MFSWRCVGGRVRARAVSWTVNNTVGSGRYHTVHGVFGYKPDQHTQYEIPKENLERRNASCRVLQLVNAYRTHGHRLANIDPVDFNNNNTKVAELIVERYGLSLKDYVDPSGILHARDSTDSVQGLVDKLTHIYCGHISYEYAYLEEEAEREWFARRVEGGDDGVSSCERVEMAQDLIKSQVWDNFLNTKFPSVKKYGGEGVDTLVTFLRTVINQSAKDDIKYIVLGMPHRGRLNLQAVLLNSPPVKLFSKYTGQPEFPSSAQVMGDIAQHFSISEDLKVDGKTVHFSLLNNPSHLEVVNPVSMGKTRSKQLELREGDYSQQAASVRGDTTLNLQIHGDAALPGQGVNQECLMLAQVPHFDIGGSVHLVVNNQVGFTTPADRGRSSTYSTDLAKSIAAPVLHVNAEYPEEVRKATRIALEYRRRFRKDVFIDLNCWRKFGHNEVDDPTFTNPALYRIIRSKQSIPDRYVEELRREGVLNEEVAQQTAEQFTSYLQSNLDKVSVYQPQESYGKRQWSGISQAPDAVQTWDTGVEADVLTTVARRSVHVPEGFTVHPRLLKTHIKNRLDKVQEGKQIDWSTAEAMAFGSLLMEGHHVRLSGEDVGRGTFSHRHAMLVDNLTNDIYIPLNYIHPKQNAFLEVANSILSEEAVLGFEYGMSIDSPHRLVVWEAQFGDFFNTAQTVIDTYIASGESKWMTYSGLVMLLPHGLDGAGADHSSCRPERFLQLSDSREAAVDGDSVNLHVAAPTTPAQYLHLLRRQLKWNYRKPLVVLAPKILLRMSEATSSISELLPGTHFLSVLGDHIAEPRKVRRVIFCSGKHYYALAEERTRAGMDDVAIIRLESLSPFPTLHINTELAKYPQARTFIWSQEEHRNQGAWNFVKPRFENLCATKLRYSGRAESACCAVGVSAWHKQEARRVVEEPLQLIK